MTTNARQVTMYAHRNGGTEASQRITSYQENGRTGKTRNLKSRGIEINVHRGLLFQQDVHHWAEMRACDVLIPSLQQPGPRPAPGGLSLDVQDTFWIPNQRNGELWCMWWGRENDKSIGKHWQTSWRTEMYRWPGVGVSLQIARKGLTHRVSPLRIHWRKNTGLNWCVHYLSWIKELPDRGLLNIAMDYDTSSTGDLKNRTVSQVWFCPKAKE